MGDRHAGLGVETLAAFYLHGFPFRSFASASFCNNADLCFRFLLHGTRKASEPLIPRAPLHRTSAFLIARIYNLPPASSLDSLQLSFWQNGSGRTQGEAGVERPAASYTPGGRMSKKNKLSTRRSQHEYELQLEREAREKREAKRAKIQRKQAAKAARGVTKSSVVVRKNNRRGIRLKKNSVVRGIRIKNADTKRKAKRLLMAEAALKMQVDG